MKGKVFITLLSLLFLLILFIYIRKPLPPDDYINEYISDNFHDGQISFNQIQIDYDSILIDSSYNIKNSLKENHTRKSNIMTYYQDEIIYIVFLKSNIIQSYSTIVSTNDSFNVLKNYVYCNSGILYQKDRVFAFESQRDADDTRGASAHLSITV